MTAKKVPEGSTKASIFNLIPSSEVYCRFHMHLHVLDLLSGDNAVGDVLCDAYSAYLLLSCQRCGGKNYEDIAVFIWSHWRYVCELFGFVITGVLATLF